MDNVLCVVHIYMCVLDYCATVCGKQAGAETVYLILYNMNFFVVLLLLLLVGGGGGDDDEDDDDDNV